MPTKLQPALYGGAFIGVLSALPFVSAGNLCCCLWIISGGAVAAYLMQQNHPTPITIGDGAVGGFFSGIVGAVVYLVVSLPFSLILGPMQRQMMDAMMRTNRQEIPDEVRQLMAQMSGGAAGLVIGFLFMLVAGMVFATIGGVIGAAVFKKSGPPATPPDIVVQPPTSA
jgi:hypothetical protein